MEKQNPAGQGGVCGSGHDKISPQNTLTDSASQAARRRLDNWRESDIRAFEFEGRRYRAQVSRFIDGSISEIFLDCAKYGSDVATHAAESAIVASIALQYGAPAAALVHGTNGPISKALALFLEGE